MKFECPSCGRAFLVPDDLLPKGKSVRLVCPKCKASFGPITAAGSEKEPGEDASPEFSEELLQELQLEDQSAFYEMVEEGMPVALIWVDNKDSLQEVKSALETMGYKVRSTDSLEMASRLLARNPYRIVLADETPSILTPEKHPLISYARNFPMKLRRNMLLCWISDRLSTMDRFSAFKMGLDLIVNRKDLARIKLILQRVLQEH